MAATFQNTVFGPGQAGVGLYTDLGILPPTYTGTSVLGGADTVTIDGTIDTPGSTVTLTQQIAGIVQVNQGATYLGFSQAGNAPPVYYFSTTNTPLTGTVISVSQGAVPTLTVVTTVDDSPTSAPAPCFVTGTRIQTRQGEVAVEDLQIGDEVITAAGQLRPIVWIGHRRIICARHKSPHEVWPVRVSAGAFGDGLPTRDLWLSPDHSVCVNVVDEVLIPIKLLLNAATIVQVPQEVVTYWHVELDCHDILLAEGMPSESFLDTGVRSTFENGHGPILLHPSFASKVFSPKTLADFCRPLVQDGSVVEAVRARLAARAEALGWTITAEPDLHIVADGAVIRPELAGETARFTLPAEARDVRLMSRTYEPLRIDPRSGDARRLGVPLRGLAVRDWTGFTRTVPLDDPRLHTGFSFVQGRPGDSWRWTDGAAMLPAELWAGASGDVILDVALVPAADWAKSGVYSVRHGETSMLAA